MQHPPQKQPVKPHSLCRRAILSIALLALAAGFAALAPKGQREQNALVVESPASAVRTLELREPASLASVSVSPSLGSPYELEMREGHLWLVEQDGTFALDEAREQELLNVLTQIVVQGTVAQNASEVAEHLADMGLAPACASAVLRYTDGTKAVIEVGASVPQTSYAYYRWSGDPGVHMCDAGIADALSLSAKRLLPVPKLQINPSLVESLRLANQSEDLLFHFTNGASGTLELPFAYPLSSEGVSALLNALQNFRLGAFQAALTEENLAQYGFDHPLCVLEIVQKAGDVNAVDENGALITVKYEASKLHLALGRTEGDFFYTCSYEGSCYLVSRFLAEALVKAQSDSFLSRYPAQLEAGNLTRAELHAPGTDLLVEVERAEKVLANNGLATGEAGEILWEVSARLNGARITGEQLDAFLDSLNTLAVAGSLPQDYVPDRDATLRWTLVLETDSGLKRTLEAYRMDAFADVLFLNGVARHYLHTDAVEALLMSLPS